VSAIIFPAELLEFPNLRPGLPYELSVIDSDTPLPDQQDVVKCVEHLVRLALLEGRPRVEWVARKMDFSGRSLQRYLNGQNTTFESVLDRVLTRHSMYLLERGNTPITELALQLGYADPSHFVRAFRRWTGQTPGEFRRSLGITRRRLAAE
jgi:AraC-like DNA-binding protein